MAESEFSIGPNLAVEDRMEVILRAPWTTEQWMHWFHKALKEVNRLEAAALAFAYAKYINGTIEDVQARVLSLLATPGTLSTPDQRWRTDRNKALESDNYIELAAIMFVLYLLNR